MSGQYENNNKWYKVSFMVLKTTHTVEIKILFVLFRVSQRQGKHNNTKLKTNGWMQRKK